MTQAQLYRDIVTWLLVAGLLMSLAVSHLHDLARFEGELELAREAYSQLVSEQIALRERLDETERRQFAILRLFEPRG